MVDPTVNPNRRRGRKRGDGEGSITQRTDGMWRGRIMVGRLPDGRPDLRTVYAKTRGEVQQKLDDIRRQLTQGAVLQRTKLTVSELLDQWIEECVTRSLRATTLESYRQVVSAYLKPALGKIKVADLRPEHVRRLCAELIRRGLSPATVRYARTLLHGALRLAMRMELVGRNVTESVSPPRYRRPQVQPPTPREVAKLIDTSAQGDDRLEALWCLAVYSGCRPGELLGLKWEDVDWTARRLTIRRNLTGASGGRPILTAPKTSRGFRAISLPEEPLERLQAHRERQRAERQRLGPDYSDFGLVFATQTGTPLLTHNVVRAFKRLLMAAELPSTIRLYDLRHAHATALLAAGIHPKVAAERLGHSSVTLTLDTYTHMIAGLDADAAARVQQAFRAAAPAEEAATPRTDRDSG